MRPNIIKVDGIGQNDESARKRSQMTRNAMSVCKIRVEKNLDAVGKPLVCPGIRVIAP